MFDLSPKRDFSACTRVLTTLLILACAFSASAIAGGQSAILYAIDEGVAEDERGNTSFLLTVDPATGLVTEIGATVEPLSLSGLAWDSVNGIMYVSDVTIGGGVRGPERGGSWGLGSIDIETGQVTLIGDHVTTNNVWGLAYSPLRDVLYGADADGGAARGAGSSGLSTLDRATGLSTYVGDFGGGEEIAALAFDAGTDTLYGIDVDNLYSIDQDTGAATMIGALGVDPGCIDCGLAYDPTGSGLYAGAADGGLYRVNTADGSATFIGNDGRSLTGLAFAGGPASVLEVPTLGETALLLFGGLLLLCGTWFLRR